MDRTNELSRPMLRAQDRLGRPLHEFLRERYVTATAGDIAAELAAKHGISVSESTITNWMDRLGIERRFPGQRPEAVA